MGPAAPAAPLHTGCTDTRIGTCALPPRAAHTHWLQCMDMPRAAGSYSSGPGCPSGHICTCEGSPFPTLRSSSYRGCYRWPPKRTARITGMARKVQRGRKQAETLSVSKEKPLGFLRRKPMTFCIFRQGVQARDQMRIEQAATHSVAGRGLRRLRHLVCCGGHLCAGDAVGKVGLAPG